MIKKITSEATEYINCIDHTITREKFSLLKNTEYDILVTQPIPSEIGKYYESEEYISHTDNSKTLIDKLYQIVRKYTLKNKLNLINSFNTDGKNLLDIGCGTGDFLNICNRRKWNVTGIEPNKRARNISISKKINTLEDIEKVENKTFDVITLWHVLEHVTNVYEYIENIKKLLKPNGVIIVAVPNYKSYDAEYYKEHWAAFDVPRHIWHFSKLSIKKIFLEFDIELIKILPMKFDSYYVAMLSEKYKNGKSNYIKSFFVGFKSNMKALRTKEYSSHIYVLKNKNI